MGVQPQLESPKAIFGGPTSSKPADQPELFASLVDTRLALELVAVEELYLVLHQLLTLQVQLPVQPFICTRPENPQAGSKSE